MSDDPQKRPALFVFIVILSGGALLVLAAALAAVAWTCLEIGWAEGRKWSRWLR